MLHCAPSTRIIVHLPQPRTTENQHPSSGGSAVPATGSLPPAGSASLVASLTVTTCAAGEVEFVQLAPPWYKRQKVYARRGADHASDGGGAGNRRGTFVVLLAAGADATLQEPPGRHVSACTCLRVRVCVYGHGHTAQHRISAPGADRWAGVAGGGSGGGGVCGVGAGAVGVYGISVCGLWWSGGVWQWAAQRGSLSVLACMRSEAEGGEGEGVDWSTVNLLGRTALAVARCGQGR